jgi:hypothetical protein
MPYIGVRGPALIPAVAEVAELSVGVSVAAGTTVERGSVEGVGADVLAAAVADVLVAGPSGVGTHGSGSEPHPTMTIVSAARAASTGRIVIKLVRVRLRGYRTYLSELLPYI